MEKRILLLGAGSGYFTFPVAARVPEGWIEHDRREPTPLRCPDPEAEALGDRLLLIADTCLCEYMSHGHCGVVAAGGAVVLGRAGELEAAKTFSPLQLIVDDEIAAALGRLRQLRGEYL